MGAMVKIACRSVLSCSADTSDLESSLGPLDRTPQRPALSLGGNLPISKSVRFQPHTVLTMHHAD